jgi:hypothetical protein
MRLLEVQLNGYEWALSTGDVDLRGRASHHRRTAMQLRLFWEPATALAPNGLVRRWLRALGSRYERVMGAPSTMQRLLAGLILERGRHERRMRAKTGRDRFVEIPPPRATRYEFVGSEAARPGTRPWTSTFLEEDAQWERFRRVHNATAPIMATVNEAARLYDHLRRRCAPERQAVDDAARIIASFAAPL